MEGSQIVETLRRLALLGLSAQSDEGTAWQKDALTDSDALACELMSRDAEAAHQIWQAVQTYEISLVGMKRYCFRLVGIHSHLST